jgi:hypothetical protein
MAVGNVGNYPEGFGYWLGQVEPCGCLDTCVFVLVFQWCSQPEVLIVAKADLRFYKFVNWPTRLVTGY